MTSRSPGKDEGAFPASTGLRAVITDIDGTLTGPDRSLNPPAAALLREIERLGSPVILATGNVLPVALAIRRCMGLHGPIVAENGGLVYEQVDGSERLTKLADRAVAWKAYRAARNSGLPVRRLFTDRWRETEVALEPSIPAPVVARAVRDHPVLVEGTGFAVHLMQLGAGKKPALDGVLDRLGLSWKECLVAGDGDNDVAMLKAAGWGISFAWGSPRARRAADHVSLGGPDAAFVEGIMERRRVGRSRRK
jgi:phosphoglycolate phosphatase (TIGR01487 family)